MYITLSRNVDMQFSTFVLKDLILLFFCAENYYKMWTIPDKNWMAKSTVYSERLCLWTGLHHISTYHSLWNFLDFNNLHLSSIKSILTFRNVYVLNIMCFMIFCLICMHSIYLYIYFNFQAGTWSSKKQYYCQRVSTCVLHFMDSY